MKSKTVGWILLAVAIALAWPVTSRACSHLGKSLTSKSICHSCSYNGSRPTNIGLGCGYQVSPRYSFCDCYICGICRNSATAFTLTLKNYAGICDAAGACANPVFVGDSSADMIDKYNKWCADSPCTGCAPQ